MKGIYIAIAIIFASYIWAESRKDDRKQQMQIFCMSRGEKPDCNGATKP